MATWVVGDVQGCSQPLLRLLERIGFGADDQLWLAGDLVNRGPDSLGVLRWARDQAPDQVHAVLGNHELHLLAVAAGARKAKRGDTLAPILTAPDREALLDWVRDRPLAHHDRGWLLVHAGLLPAWDLPTTLERARHVERALRGPDGAALLTKAGPRKLRAALHALTRLRFVDADGEPDYGPKGPPGSAPGCAPWFDAPGRRWAGQARIVHGHWAALGLRVSPEVVSLDTGCVWGRALTAFCLEDERVVQVPARP